MHDPHDPNRLGWPNSPTPWPAPPAPAPMHHPAVDLALLRQGMEHLGDRVQAHSERISAIDERVRKMGSRLGKLEDGAAVTAATLAKIEDLPAKVSAMSTRNDTVIEIVKWAAGGVILIAAVAGKIPWDHALKLLGK